MFKAENHAESVAEISIAVRFPGMHNISLSRRDLSPILLERRQSPERKHALHRIQSASASREQIAIQENCMSTTSAVTSVPATSPKAILWAGLVAGTMDITAAFVVY